MMHSTSKSIYKTLTGPFSFFSSKNSVAGLDVRPLPLTRWRRIRERQERENGAKGHSSGGRRNQCFSE